MLHTNLSFGNDFKLWVHRTEFFNTATKLPPILKVNLIDVICVMLRYNRVLFVGELRKKSKSIILLLRKRDTQTLINTNFYFVADQEILNLLKTLKIKKN